MSEHYSTLTAGPDTTVWPPQFDPSHNRYKGFYSAVLDSELAVQDFAQKMQGARSTAVHTATRLSARAVTDPRLLGDLERVLEPSGMQVEAAIPLHGMDDSLVVVYTGWNALGRRTPHEQLQQHSRTLDSAVSRPRHNSSVASGLRIEFIDQATSEATRRGLIPRFAGIYALFGYSDEQTEELLLDPANVIAYVCDTDGDVASTAMAAYEAPRLDGIDIPMVEITEAFTAPAHRGRGLYRAVSGGLLSLLLSPDSPRVAAIYGEGNAAKPRVISAAHQNGRHFSYYERQEYGVTNPSFGILTQAYRIEDGRPESERLPYNDLVVSYYPLERTL